jgi:acetyltransferase
MTDTAESTIQLNNGHRVRVRPIAPGDEDLLYDAFSRMSERSVYLRFLSPLKRLPEETAHRLAHVDHGNRYALIAVEGPPGKERMLGVARYDRIGDSDTAEVAVAVPDDVQRQGIGAQLLSRIAEQARTQGIKQFMVLVLAENKSMLHLLRKMGWIHQARAKGGAYEITFDV